MSSPRWPATGSRNWLAMPASASTSWPAIRSLKGCGHCSAMAIGAPSSRTATTAAQRGAMPRPRSSIRPVPAASLKTCLRTVAAMMEWAGIRRLSRQLYLSCGISRLAAAVGCSSERFPAGCLKVRTAARLSRSTWHCGTTNRVAVTYFPRLTISVSARPTGSAPQRLRAIRPGHPLDRSRPARRQSGARSGVYRRSH